MTIANTTNREDYVGNGATSVYPYGFKIFSDSDLTVTSRDLNDVETALVLDTDYTVSGAGDKDGGNVTLTAGNLTTGYALTIRRVRPLTQMADIRNQGTFFANTHEDVFDHFIMIEQQQQNEIDRCLQLPETEAAAGATLPAPVAYKWFRWNAAGTALESVDAGDLTAVTTVGPDLVLASSNLSITLPNRFGVAGGTVDAITTTTSPVVASLTNNLLVVVQAAGANTITTPTFAPDGMTAKTIVKENNIALAIGDIPGADYRMILVFDSALDKWILLNPHAITTFTTSIYLPDPGAADADISNFIAWKAPLACTITKLQLIPLEDYVAAASANDATIDVNKNNGATAVASLNVVTALLQGSINDMGSLDASEKILDAGDNLTVDLTANGTANIPAQILQVDYEIAN